MSTISGGKGPTRTPDDANARLFLDTIEKGAEDAVLVILGDSTSAGTYSWSYIVAQRLADRYPTHTVRWSLFDDTTKTYPAQTSLSTGTGSRYIDIWNAAIGSTRTKTAVRWLEVMAGEKAPHLVIISHGHNQAYSGGAGMITSDFLTLTESIAARLPGVSICLVGQNPRIGDTVQTVQMAPRISRVAQMRGYGWVDFHRAFVAYGAWDDDLMADAIHPNAAGYALCANVMLRALEPAERVRVRSQPPSSLVTAADNLLVNGDFASFTGTALTSWTTSTYAVLSSDTTHYESQNGYAVRITASDAQVSHITQSLGAALAYRLRGQWVTLAARVRVDAASGTTTAGGILISDGIGSNFAYPTDRLADADGFVWVATSYQVDAAAATLIVRLFGDGVANANADVTFDRVTLTRGLLPRDTAIVATSAGGASSGSIWVPAGEMWPSATNGATAIASSEMATNKQTFRYLTFPETSITRAETTVGMPADWNVTSLEFYVRIFMTVLTTQFFNAHWLVQARAYADEDDLDATWGDAVGVNLVQGGAGGYPTAQIRTSLAVTAAGTPGAGQLLQVRISRDPDDPADNMTVPAQLLGIRIDYPRS